MRIKRVHIENFRSIRRLDVDCGPLMIFLGPNNAGKTNLLLALDFFFAGTRQKMDAGEFFRIEDERGRLIHWASEAIVEVTFGELEPQDRKTFQRYVVWGDELRVQKRAIREGDSVEVEYHGYRNVPLDGWMDPEKVADYAHPEVLRQVMGDDLYTHYFPNYARVTQAALRRVQEEHTQTAAGTMPYEQELEEGPLLGVKSIVATQFGDFSLVPAVRDVTDEMKYQTTTNIGALLGDVMEQMSETDEQFAIAREALQNLVQALSYDPERGHEGRPAQLVQLEQDLARELGYWGLRGLDIGPRPVDVEDLFRRGIELHVDDGLRTDVGVKGHGLQRAVILGLIRLRAKYTARQRAERAEREVVPRAPSPSVYIAVEEPELFLHPQAQRETFEALKELAAEPHFQVFLCTHSSFFVDMDMYRSLCVIHKPSLEEGTQKLQCCEELFEGEGRQEKKHRLQMAAWFDPNRSELFFARKAALVEGIAEKTVFPMLARRLGVFSHDVYVVDCGGKNSIPLYVEVLNAFKIPYIVVHDIDPQNEAEARTNAEIARLVSECGEIERFDPKFEVIAGIPDTRNKQFAAFERFAPIDAEIPERIKDVVRKIYQ